MAIFIVVVPAAISNILVSFLCLRNSYFIHIYIYWKMYISYLDAI